MSQAKFGITQRDLSSLRPADATVRSRPLSKESLSAFDALEQCAGRLPTQSSAWYVAASRHLHTPNKTRLITARDASRFHALAAVAQSTHPELAFIAQDLIYEPSDFLYDSDESLEELLNAILSNGQPLLIRRLDAGSRAIDLLRSGVVRPAYHRIRPTNACPMIYLDESWLEPEACLSSRARQDFRRALRKAEKLGKVTFSIASPTPDDLPAILETALAIEASGWKGVTGSALLHDTIRGSFMRDYARIAAARRELRIAMLYIDGRPAAMQLAVDVHNSRWLFKIGYDPEFASCSPGQILMRHSIAEAASEQLSTFEFLGSIAPWTETWTREHRECVSLELYPASMRSAWSLARRAGRAARSRQHLASITQSLKTRLFSNAAVARPWQEKT